MSMWVTAEFHEAWRYAGWTTTQESAAGGSVDSSGDLVLCGKSLGLGFSLDDDTFTSTVSADFAAVKLRGDIGEELWTWEDTSDSPDRADWMVSVDTDSLDNVIFGGFTSGNWGTNASNSDGNRSIAAVKLTGSSGEEIWRYQNAPSTTSQSSGISYVQAVAVDKEDNVFLFGSTSNSAFEGEDTSGDWSFVVIKLDGATGGELWRTLGGVSYTREGLVGAEVNSAGDVVAAGYTANEETEKLDFLAVKLSGSDGSVLWEYSTNTSTGDVFNSVDIDKADDVFLAGGEGSPNLQGEIAQAPVVVKLDGVSGAEIWAYSGNTSSRTMFKSVAVDPMTGWVVAAGLVQGDWIEGAGVRGFDFAAVVLDDDTGAEIARYQNGTGGTDVIEFAEFDAHGALFFGGYSSAAWTGGAGDEDMIAIKFEPLRQSVLPTLAPSASATPGPTYVPTPNPTHVPTQNPTQVITPSPTKLPTPSPTRTPTPYPTHVDTPIPSTIGLSPSGDTVAPVAPVAPTPMPIQTPSPSTAARGIPAQSAVPTQAPTSDDTGSTILTAWQVGAIIVGGTFFSLLMGLWLLSGWRKAHARLEASNQNPKALQIMPVPSTRDHLHELANVYKSNSISPSSNVLDGSDGYGLRNPMGHTRFPSPPSHGFV